MASEQQTGDEVKEMSTSDGKANDGEGEKMENVSDEKSMETLVTDPDDVTKSSALHTSTNVSDWVAETGSSTSTTGSSDATVTSILTNDADTEANVIGEEIVEKERGEELSDVVGKCDIGDEAKVEGNEEVRDVVTEVKERSKDETKDTIGDEDTIEVNEGTIGHAEDVIKDANEKSMTETENTFIDEAKTETNVETNEETNVETKFSNPGEGEIEEDASSISIDEDIWRYMMKTKDWTNRIERIKEELSVEIEESTSGDGMTLRVSGLIRSNVKQAVVEVGTVILECKDVVNTIDVPCLDNQVHSKVVRLLKAINKLPCYVSAAPDLIRVSGTREEIGSCLEKLGAYGIDHTQAVVKDAYEKLMTKTKNNFIDESKTGASEEVNKTKDSDNHEGKDEVRDDSDGRKLVVDTERSEAAADGKRIDFPDDTGNEMEHSAGKTGEVESEEDASSISIDEEIWRYMMKTKDWTNRIERIKQELSVEIEESTSGDGMTLRVSGLIRSNVKQAVVEVGTVILECKDVVSTIDVPCLDNQVHSKVVRLIRSINKLPCYVSTAPDLVRVTGRREEIGSCLEKLGAYGIQYELEKKDVAEEPFPEENSMVDNLYQPSESLTKDVQVPIEKHLWHFISEKRKSELRDIEDGFGVIISTRPTNDVSTVTVSISVLSSDNTQLLDTAREALGQLLDRLCLQIVVTAVLEGESVARMPPEVVSHLRQDLADVDVILEIISSSTGQRPGHRLLLIGPEKEIALSKDKINRAFEKIFTDNADPRMLNALHEGRSNGQQVFPGSGNRLGIKDSAMEGHSIRDNPHGGHAAPTASTGGAPIRDNASAGSVRLGPPGPNHAVQPGQSNTSERKAEPTPIRGTPLQAPAASQSQAAGGASNDSSGTIKKSSVRPTENSKTEEKSVKEKKVTFSDDGIRVYPTDSNDSNDNSSKADTADNAANRSEQKESRCPKKTETESSRNDCDESCTTNGLHISVCSTCKDESDSQRVSDCNHVFCLTCVRDYLDPAASCCPLCGNSGRPTAAATQPIGGQMLVTYNNTGRLPGFENKSKGIIVVTYVFNEGHQTDDYQNPGKPYPGLTKTAFLPLSPVGNEVLDLLQKAFDARVTFRFTSTPNHPNGELVWNDILHKENIFGGPRVGGFPDPVYLDRIRQDLLTKGFH